MCASNTQVPGTRRWACGLQSAPAAIRQEVCEHRSDRQTAALLLRRFRLGVCRVHVIHCLSGVLLYRRYGQYCVHIPRNGRGITQRGGGSRGSARVHRFEIKQVCDPVRRREVSDTLRAPLHTASVETRKEQLQSELAQHK